MRPCHWPGALWTGTPWWGAGSGSRGPGAPGGSCGGVAGLLWRGAGRSAAGSSRSRCTFADEGGAGKGPQAATSKHTAGQNGRLRPGPAAPSLRSPGLAAGLGRLPRLLVGVVQAGLPPGAVLDGGAVQARRLGSIWLQPLEALGRGQGRLGGSLWNWGCPCRSGEPEGSGWGAGCAALPRHGCRPAALPPDARKGFPHGPVLHPPPPGSLAGLAPWLTCLRCYPLLPVSSAANPLLTYFSCFRRAQVCHFLASLGTPLGRTAHLLGHLPPASLGFANRVLDLQTRVLPPSSPKGERLWPDRRPSGFDRCTLK